MNTAQPHHPDLQLDEDMAFQRRQWIVQYVAWWFMATIVLAALLGLFGSGPISNSVASSENLRLEYERFARIGDETELRFQLEPTAASEAVLLLDQQLIEAVTLESIQPQPDTIQPRVGWVAFGFNVPDQNSFAVRFILRRHGAGSLVGQARLGTGAPLTFTQLAYP